MAAVRRVPKSACSKAAKLLRFPFLLFIFSLLSSLLHFLHSLLALRYMVPCSEPDRHQLSEDARQRIKAMTKEEDQAAFGFGNGRQHSLESFQRGADAFKR